MRPVVPLLIVLLSSVLAGCLGPGGFGADRTDVFLDTEFLNARGPNIQPVALQTIRPRSEPVSPDSLKIQGVTHDDRVVAVAPVAEQVETVWDGPDQVRQKVTLLIDVSDLVARDVAHLTIVPTPESGTVVTLPVLDDDAPGEAVSSPEGPGADPIDATWRPGRQSRLIRAGTRQATRVHIIRGDRPGPTVMIVGGVHGSETSGWRAARDVVNWPVDAGTVVVIPDANRPAIQRNRRTGRDGVDLNRQFPVGRRPLTALARAIWGVVQEFRPVALLDLHEGWGLRAAGHRFPGGTLSVGQTLIAYGAGDAVAFARHVTEYLNTHHVADQRRYSFSIIGPPLPGTLARKAGSELGIPAFIAEPSQHRTTLATRIRWQKVIVEEFLKWYGVLDAGRETVPRRYRDAEEVVAPAPLW